MISFVNIFLVKKKPPKRFINIYKLMNFVFK